MKKYLMIMVVTLLFFAGCATQAPVKIGLPEIPSGENVQSGYYLSNHELTLKVINGTEYNVKLILDTTDGYQYPLVPGQQQDVLFRKAYRPRIVVLTAVASTDEGMVGTLSLQLYIPEIGSEIEQYVWQITSFDGETEFLEKQKRKGEKEKREPDVWIRKEKY